jgi:hypothetical protein
LSNFGDALERLHRGGLEYADGLANHGPMGAEALECLGHPALIPAFLDIYAPRLPPAVRGRVLSESETDSMLGDMGRASDWVATFEARLDGGDWREVVSASLPELLPGVFAAAGHGFLRTAHAVRALTREDTPLRRRELARGLAHWSARFQSLPGLPGSRAGEQPELAEVFAAWPLVASADARVGLIFEAVRHLEGSRAFVRAVESVGPPSEEGLDAFLTDLCRIAASLYLAHPEARIPYVHAMTIPSALRLVAPLLPARAVCRGALFALQAVGAIHSIYGTPGPPSEPDEEVRQTAGSWDEIRYRAACSIQEHAIKMAEACWREDRLAPDPILALAAADAAVKLAERRSAGDC